MTIIQRMLQGTAVMRSPPGGAEGAAAEEGDPNSPADGSAADGEAESAEGSGGSQADSANAGEEPEGEAEAEPEAAPQAAPADAPEWAKRRIAKLTAKYHTEAAKAKALEERLAAAAKGTAPAAVPPEEVRAQAQALKEAEEFQAKCTAVTTAGKAAFPDWDGKISNILAQFDNKDPEELQAYTNLVRVLIDTDIPAKLFHSIGSDPALASRLMSLTPAQMGREVAKLETKLVGETAAAAAAAVSKAPKPPTTVKGTPHTAVSASDPERADKLSTAEWMKRRNAEAQAKRQASGRR